MEDLERIDPSLAVARKAFLGLVQDIRPQLHRYCARMTGSALDGEDLVQDTLATAYYKLSLMNQEIPLRAWLFKIAHNKCIDFLRLAHPHEEWTVDGFDESVPFNDEIERLEDLHHAFRRLVLVLPPMERACVIFKDVLDYDLASIVDTLETSIGGVKAALHRGRQKLRSAAADQPGQPSEQSDLLKLYVERFNARDWNGLHPLSARRHGHHGNQPMTRLARQQALAVPDSSSACAKGYPPWCSTPIRSIRSISTPLQETASHDVDTSDRVDEPR